MCSMLCLRFSHFRGEITDISAKKESLCVTAKRKDRRKAKEKTRKETRKNSCCVQYKDDHDSSIYL